MRASSLLSWGKLLGDTHSLCEETVVVGEVQDTGQKFALLEDAGDVATWACMAGADVDKFGRGFGGTSGWWWKAAVCFLGK